MALRKGFIEKKNREIIKRKKNVFERAEGVRIRLRKKKLHMIQTE